MALQPPSDHFDGTHFFMPGHTSTRSAKALLKWIVSPYTTPWPTQVTNTGKATLVAPGDTDSLGVTWLGHATLLIQLGGLNVLTDPLFSQRPSPLSFAGPSRVRPPGLSLDELPPIHAVVISHNHYDHLDLPSLKAIEKRWSPLFIVPLGNAALLREHGLSRVQELDWWESHVLGDGGVTVTLTPALHWGARGLFDRYKTLWGSYFLRGADGKSAYFAGDSGYFTHFKEIHARLGPPDVALLPIGAYEPRDVMREHHLNPEEAVLAHLDLQARHSIPMHYATVRLTDEAFDAPLAALEAAKAAHGVESFEALELGSSWVQGR